MHPTNMKTNSPLVKLFCGTLLLISGLATVSAQSTWDGGGGNATWTTAANWVGDALPASGADVTFGTGFASGATITLNGNKTVGNLTYDSAGTRVILTGSTLTVNSSITRAAGTTATSDIQSALSLPNDIVINNNATSGGTLNLTGTITGAGKITMNTTSSSAISLGLGGNNSGWSGGLTLGSSAANSSVNVNGATALGTGDITWLAGTNGPTITFNTDVNYTVANNFVVTGERIINPYNVSGGLGKTIALTGNITGGTGATIRFVPRQTNITGAITELNGTNTNADSASRIIFYGSTNDTTSALGMTYVIGNNSALDWGRVIMGQTATAVDDVVLLYKDGITISKMIELNDTDAGSDTLGVYGTSANATQNATIQLSNFGAAFSKTLKLSADTGSTFTVNGAMTTSNGTDTLNVQKIGAGTVKLNSASGSSYTGTTTVTTGTLLINNTSGSGTGTGAVTVDGGTLGGSGSFTGALTVNAGGTLAPGASIESLGSGALALNTGSTFGYEVDSGVVGADLQRVTGNLSLSGTVTLTLTNLSVGTFANATKFTLINYTGTWNNGLFTYDNVSLANGATFSFNGQNWRIDYDASSGGSNFSSEYLGGSYVNITVVPEPATWALLAFSLTTVMILRRRKNN